MFIFINRHIHSVLDMVIVKTQSMNISENNSRIIKFIYRLDYLNLSYATSFSGNIQMCMYII